MQTSRACKCRRLCSQHHVDAKEAAKSHSQKQEVSALRDKHPHWSVAVDIVLSNDISQPLIPIVDHTPDTAQEIKV